jgi:hypothetical protein
MVTCENGGMAPIILNLGTICRGIFNFVPSRLYLQDDISLDPFNRKLRGPQTLSATFEDATKFHPSWGLEPVSCLAQPVVQSEYRLRHPGSLHHTQV